MKYTKEQLDRAKALRSAFGQQNLSHAVDLIWMAEPGTTLDAINRHQSTVEKSIDVAGVDIPAVGGVEIVD
jgi:hypothetical protein